MILLNCAGCIFFFSFLWIVRFFFLFFSFFSFLFYFFFFLCFFFVFCIFWFTDLKAAAGALSLATCKIQNSFRGICFEFGRYSCIVEIWSFVLIIRGSETSQIEKTAVTLNSAARRIQNCFFPRNFRASNSRYSSWLFTKPVWLKKNLPKPLISKILSCCFD